jgi:hypothetical protein
MNRYRATFETYLNDVASSQGLATQFTTTFINAIDTFRSLDRQEPAVFARRFYHTNCLAELGCLRAGLHLHGSQLC